MMPTPNDPFGKLDGREHPALGRPRFSPLRQKRDQRKVSMTDLETFICHAIAMEVSGEQMRRVHPGELMALAVKATYPDKWARIELAYAQKVREMGERPITEAEIAEAQQRHEAEQEAYRIEHGLPDPRVTAEIKRLTGGK